MNNRFNSMPITLALALASLAIGAIPATQSQEVLAWDAAQYFRFKIEQAQLGFDVTSGQRTVTVLFSVTDPTRGQAPWDIRRDPVFTQPAGVSRLALDIGWSTTDYHNTGSVRQDLQSVAFGGGVGPGLALSVDLIRNAVPVGEKYQVMARLPSQASGTATLAIEGHPAWPVDSGGTVTWERVPVKSVVSTIALSDIQPVPRRAIVSIDKCKVCHDGEVHKGHEIPRLSLHGANRTEELGLCVVCHNANATDIPYRTAGPETPIDFKHMVHAIHGAKKRETPFVVLGRGGSVNDFSSVDFPANPRDCARCHIDRNGRGTFELPVARTAMGTTFDTRSVPGSIIDLDPANNLRMTPTAGACSGCHDSEKALVHMAARRSGGAFGVLQSDIDNRRAVERCVDCHGPAGEKSVRKVHR
jgi:OmcA/MtrC family decaheme c-type cytochrome